MEYSVYDLIRILIRRWYIILLTMCLVGGVSVFTAQQSYTKALSDYESYTSEIEETATELGTAIAVYRFGYYLNDMTKYLEQAEQKAAFIQQYLQSVGGEYGDATQQREDLNDAVQAYNAATADFQKLLVEPKVLSNAQLAINQLGYMEEPTVDANGNLLPGTPLLISNHLVVEKLESNILQLTITGVEETVATKILQVYLDNLNLLGETLYSMNITMEQKTLLFTEQPPQSTAAASFAQMVMKKPEQAPILVKTVGTAAVYAFAFACFGILLVTFVRDTRPRKEKTEKEA